MRNLFFEAAQRRNWRERVMDTVYSTPIEIYVGAAFVGLVGGGIGYHINAERAENMPVAFSEVGKTIKRLEAEGKTVPPLTLYYASTSDAVMKVLEAYNEAHAGRFSNESFARELEVKTDRALRIHRQLDAYAADAPARAQAALKSVEKLSQAASELPAVIHALSEAWEDDHTDYYRTEYDTETQCDANNNCTTVTVPRQVYDHTVHSYTYNRDQGEAAARLMRQFLEKFPDLRIDERLVLSTRTDADNEYAIEKSMKAALEGKIPTQEQALRYANMWATGSNYASFMPVIQSNHAGVSAQSPAWDRAKNTAESDSYSTYSSSDDGPEEFQIAEKALDHAEAVQSAIGKITGGISYGGAGVPALNDKVRAFIGATLDGKAGDPDKLRAEVMQTATGIYKANFENGLDVQPFRIEEVLAFTLGGALLGGLGGMGLDRYLTARRGRGFGSLRDRFGRSSGAGTREVPAENAEETPAVPQEPAESPAPKKKRYDIAP